MKSRKKWFYGIVAISVLILICFSISEIYLRTIFSKVHNRLVLEYKDRELTMTHSTVPGLIYENIPNKYGVNSQGYYDYEYDYAKNNGVFRIVIIGDSVAAGLGLKLNQFFGKVLEAKLNKNNLLNSKKRKIEVIILARSGYSTSQELILLENEAFNYSPNLIIWSYILNDPAHPVYHNANGELGLFFFKPKFHTIEFISKRLFILNEKIKGKNCDKEYHKFLHYVYWDQVKLHINQIGQISDKNNVPILFLIHPVFEENRNFDNYSLTSLHMKLGEVAFKSGLEVLDLLDAYKHYNPDDIKQQKGTLYDPWHSNAKGHMIIAENIYNRIDKRIKEWLYETR